MKETDRVKKKRFKYLRIVYQLGSTKRKLFVFFAFLSIIITAMSLVAQNIPRIIIDDVVPDVIEKNKAFEAKENSINELTENNVDNTTEINRTGKLSNYSTFFMLAIGYLLLVLFETVGRIITMINVEKASIDIVSDLKVRIFYHLTKTNLDFFHRNPVGRLITRVEGDVEKLRLVFSFLMVNVFGQALQSVAFFLYMFIYNFSLTIWLIIPVGVMMIISIFYQKLVRPRMVKLRKKVAKITGYIAESITGIRTIQAFRNEKDFIKRFGNQVEEWRKEQLKIFFMLLAYFRGAVMLERLANWTIIFIFGLITQKQTGATIGELIMFTNLVSYAVLPIRIIFEQIGQIQEAFASLERIDGIMHLKREDGKELYVLTEKQHDLNKEEAQIEKAISEIKVLKKGIEFKDVWFAYENENESELDKKIFGDNKSNVTNNKDITNKKNEWVLKGVSFYLPAGKSLALIGATGCGKTTIIKLLFRFYTPQKGQILLDDKDINEYSLHELRAYMGLVQQENHLFPGTIKENITLNNKFIIDEEILESSNKVGSHQFIIQRDNEYESEVKERGMNYSSGEKQLIAFTRCLVYNRPVLILDEATSNIDANSERLIQNTIINLLESNKTSIMIAHRLSTIRHADNIIVMDSGKIIESGNHNELIALNGKYKQYFKYQLSESAG